MTAIDDVFESLLFGTGSYLGLILISIMLIGLFLRWKETAVISIPVFFIFGIQYLQHDLAYQAAIAFIGGTFIILALAKEHL